MDPFSAEGELLNIHNHFHQGQYQHVIDYDTSTLSVENKIPAQVIVLRSRIALGQGEEVLKEISNAKQVELQAVAALADVSIGKSAKAEKSAAKLAAEHGENAIVQVVVGTVLHALGNSEEALTLLGNHQGNLEAVALSIQIHLEQNRLDLALKEVQAARRWAQDSLLVNIAESWIGLRMGGEKYQQAFYVFEELAQAPATTSTQSLCSQAVAELHLGRIEEAEAALKQALEKDPRNAEAIANMIVLGTIAGRDTSQTIASLRNIEPKHAFLQDIQDKSALFDKAATKYSAKVKS